MLDRRNEKKNNVIKLKLNFRRWVGEAEENALAFIEIAATSLLKKVGNFGYIIKYVAL